MNIFGLIGYPLSHSFSKKYFTQKFEVENILDCQYELFPIEKIEELSTLLQHNSAIKGLNVTIPYKEAVLSYMSKLDESATTVGAVNTIKVTPHGLEGYNTDVYGFEQSLINLIQKSNRPFPNQALVLGTGGAAKAVNFVLKKLNIQSHLVSRNVKKAKFCYENIDQYVLNEHQLIINTTPLGMSPNVETYPLLPYEYIGKNHLLFDLVYNPGKTVFLKKGEAKGAAIQNGMEMLRGQAEKAWEIWNH